jgi:hypothetical protein
MAANRLVAVLANIDDLVEIIPGINFFIRKYLNLVVNLARSWWNWNWNWIQIPLCGVVVVV